MAYATAINPAESAISGVKLHLQIPAAYSIRWGRVPSVGSDEQVVIYLGNVNLPDVKSCLLILSINIVNLPDVKSCLIILLAVNHTFERFKSLNHSTSMYILSMEISHILCQVLSDAWKVQHYTNLSESVRAEGQLKPFDPQS